MSKNHEVPVIAGMTMHTRTAAEWKSVLAAMKEHGRDADEEFVANVNKMLEGQPDEAQVIIVLRGNQIATTMDIAVHLGLEPDFKAIVEEMDKERGVGHRQISNKLAVELQRKTYDEQIKPLVHQIFDIANSVRMQFILAFQVGDWEISGRGDNGTSTGITCSVVAGEANPRLVKAARILDGSLDDELEDNDLPAGLKDLLEGLINARPITDDDERVEAVAQGIVSGKLDPDHCNCPNCQKAKAIAQQKMAGGVVNVPSGSHYNNKMGKA